MTTSAPNFLTINHKGSILFPCLPEFMSTISPPILYQIVPWYIIANLYVNKKHNLNSEHLQIIAESSKRCLLSFAEEAEKFSNISQSY